MATFIEEVASRLYDKYGDGVSSLTMVMPSKRARLFFAEALAKVAIGYWLLDGVPPIGYWLLDGVPPIGYWI